MKQLTQNEIVEARDLIEKIRKWKSAYYSGHPLVSDQIYDGAEFRLAQLIPNHPVLSEVGAVMDGFETLNYVESGADKMLSLDKVHSIDEAIKFIGGRDYVPMVKLDGMSVRAVYEDGKLILAHSRGNGISGDVFTGNFYFVRDAVPENIDKSIKFEVRGEVCVTNKDFEAMNKEREENGEVIFSNPRNATALLKQKDFLEVAKSRLVFLAYVLKIENHPELSKREQLVLLERMGFKTPMIKNSTAQKGVKECIEEFTRIRDTLPIVIDGLVFALNDVNLRQSLGYTSHHPKYEIAYKFASEKGRTFLREIQWNVTRTRRIVPTGIIDPIELSGAVCSRVTLNNAKWVLDNRIAVGEEIIVERANDVIPHFTETIKQTEDIPIESVCIPTICPSCSTKLVQTGVDMECPNLNCNGASIEYLKFYVSKPVTNMDTIGDKIIDQLYDAGFVKTPADLFKLTKAQIMTLDRMGEKKCENILESIKTAKKQDKEMFLRSLGIDGLGKTVSKLIVDKIDWSSKILRLTSELRDIEGIGPIISQNIKDGLNNKLEFISELLNYIEIEDKQKIMTSKQVFHGETFCITGKVIFIYEDKEYSERDDIQKLIESLGGKVVSSVSGKLNYLLAGENAGSKLDKATELGVTVISADDFVKMIGE